MPDERFAKTKLALQIVQTAAIIFAAASLWVSYTALRDDHEYKRRQFTAELISSFNGKIKEIRGPLMDAYPGLHNVDAGQPPSFEDCRKMIKAKRGDFRINDKVDAFEVRAYLLSAFNNFEHVAYAFERHLGNQPEIEESFSHVILRWDSFFGNCVRAANEEMKSDNWPPLTRVVGTWKANREKRVQPVPKTGQ
jgi:hypothetical protein